LLKSFVYIQQIGFRSAHYFVTHITLYYESKRLVLYDVMHGFGIQHITGQQ